MFYKWTWKDAATGWLMKLNIIPAGDGIIDRSGEYLPIPEEVISITNYSKAKQEKLIGMAKAPTLKVSVNLQYLPDDVAYDEFREAVTSPQKEKTVSISNSHFWTALNVVAGTIWEYEIDFGTGLGYEREMIGLQIDGIEDVFDSDNNYIDLTIEHICRHVMESVDFKQVDKTIPNSALIKSDQYTSRLTSYIIQKSDGDIDYFGGITADYSSGAMFEYSYYRIYHKYVELIKAHDAIMLAFLRSNNFTSTIYMPQVFYYEQSFGQTDARGSELDFFSVFHLAYIHNTVSNEMTGGYFYQNNKSGIFGKYSNMYDYMADMSEQCYNTFDYGADYVTFYNVYSDNLADVEIIVDNTSRQKLQHCGLKLNSVVTSLWEFNEGDIEEALQRWSGTTDRDSSYTIPVCENISQIVPDGENIDVYFRTLSDGSVIKFYNTKNMMKDAPYRGHTSTYYYYKEWKNHPYWVMVNARPKVKYSNSYSSDDMVLSPGELYNYATNFTTQSNLSPSIIHSLWQIYQGHAGMSRASLYEHNQRNEKLTLEFPIYLYPEMLMYNRRVLFDCATLAPRYANRPNKWRIISFEWSVEDGKATVELIPEAENAN